MGIKRENIGVGIGVMILRGNKVLLGKRHGNPQKADSELHGEDTWTMPGGKLRLKEGLSEVAAREVSEETSIKIKKAKIISLSNDIVKDAHFITIGFLCTDFEGEPRVMEPNEITEWRWFDLKLLPEKMFFPSKKIVENYLQGILCSDK